MRSQTILSLLIMLILVAGCAHRRVRITPASISEIPPCFEQSADSKECGWWSARFKLHWPEGSEPDLALDLLVADSVIRPVLTDNIESIALWRFHRRAVRDSTGHQFTFHFYTTRLAAQKLFSALRAQEVLQKLLAKQVIESIGFDSPKRDDLKSIRALNDARWSEPIQEGWIWFAMGTSATWLDIVTEFRRNSGWSSSLSSEELVLAYQAINKDVLQLWREEGKIAFLHHLNALFGYGPVKVDGEEKTF